MTSVDEAWRPGEYDLVQCKPQSLFSERTSSSSSSCPVSLGHAEELWNEGFTIIDDFLTVDRARHLREEVVQFARSGRMPEHRFQFGSSRFVKPHVFEADLHDDNMQSELPQTAELLFDEGLVKRLNALLPELHLVPGPKGKSLKVQHNAGGGGCFPCHYDNPGKPNHRAITCVVYLNPGWSEGDGGEIVLSPFLQPEVVVPPLMGRAVLFRSDLMLHRVRPAARERFCFTIWLDGKAVNKDEDCNLLAKHLSTDGKAVACFSRSPVQRAVSRSVYAEEYEQSLRDCMHGTHGMSDMLEEHWKHVQAQLVHPKLAPFIAALRALKHEKLSAPQVELDLAN